MGSAFRCSFCMPAGLVTNGTRRGLNTAVSTQGVWLSDVSNACSVCDAVQKTAPNGRGSQRLMFGGFSIIRHQGGLYSHHSAPSAEIVVTTDRRGRPSSRYSEALLTQGWGKAQYHKLCRFIRTAMARSIPQTLRMPFWLVPATHLTSHLWPLVTTITKAQYRSLCGLPTDQCTLGLIPQILCIELFAALGGALLVECRSFWGPCWVRADPGSIL